MALYYCPKCNGFMDQKRPIEKCCICGAEGVREVGEKDDES